MSRSQPLTRSAPPGAPASKQRINPMAVWSLILAILTLGGLGSIAGIIMGMAARRQAAVTGDRGAGIAVAGVVIGVLTLLLAIGYWIFLGMHFSGGGGYGY